MIPRGILIFQTAVLRNSAAEKDQREVCKTIWYVVIFLKGSIDDWLVKVHMTRKLHDERVLVLAKKLYFFLI